MENLKETISEKAVADKIDYDERAFEYLAPNAPEEVKKAWMKAAKETGAMCWEHPLEPLSRRSWEVQKHIEKEMAFYRAFIDKLERL